MAREAKKKRDRRITVFDVVIVLLIIGLLAAFAYRVYDGIADPGFEKDSKYSVEFVCDSEYNSIAKYLKDGEAVYLASTGELLGNLYATSSDSVITVIGGSADVETDESGEATEELYETVTLAGSLRLSAEADAVSSGGYYTVGGINVTVGSTVDVYTEDTVFYVEDSFYHPNSVKMVI